jgi:hypothetical protein
VYARILSGVARMTFPVTEEGKVAAMSEMIQPRTQKRK